MDTPPPARPGSSHAARKRDHLRLALSSDVGFATVTTGLDDVHLAARALPACDLDAVSLTTSWLGRDLGAPLLISCMTGGTGAAGPVNRSLAAAAEHHRIALGLGSGRTLLAEPSANDGFLVRDLAPSVPLLANLGVSHLPEVGIAGCRELVARCEADALVLHLNSVQEAVQPGGDTRFGGVREAIGEVIAHLEVPVVVKEVGFGLAPDDVAELVGLGVAAVDVAGAGGTNWARLEGHRDAHAAALARAFHDWGWPTVPAVAAARTVLDDTGADATLVGSGGVRHGVDAAKLLALGADLVGVGRGVLAAAAEGPEAATAALGVVVAQLRIAVWGVGATASHELTAAHLRR